MELLLVVDFQKDFVNGSLGFGAAAALDEKIAAKIAEYRRAGKDIAFTLDTHGEDYLSTQEGRKLPVVHCVKGTEGHGLYGKTAKQKLMCDMVFEKNTFPSLDLAKYLEQKCYRRVELVGLVSNICVISNAVMVKSALPEAEIIINEEYTASADEKLHRECLDVLEGLQVTVIRKG